MHLDVLYKTSSHYIDLEILLNCGSFHLASAGDIKILGGLLILVGPQAPLLGFGLLKRLVCGEAW